MEIENDCCRPSLTDPVIYNYNIHNIYSLHYITSHLVSDDTDGKQK